MLWRVSTDRPVAVLWTLVLALALVGLGAWFLARPTRPRGVRAPAPTSLPRPETPSPTSALQPATEPARSSLPPASASPAEASARLVVRIVRDATRRAEEVTLTLVQGGGRSASEFTLGASQTSLEVTCPPGDVSVTARGSGSPALVSLPAHATLQPGATELLELVLTPETVLHGTLEDEFGGVLGGFDVRLRRRNEVLAHAISDAAGRFRLGPLQAGSYELVLGDLEGPLRPPETLVLAPGDPPRTFVLPELLSLALRVLDGEGAGVAEVRVEGTGKPGGHLQGVTDAEGRLRLERLPPGDYRVFARHATLGRATRALVLDVRTSADEHTLVLQR